MTAFQAKFSCKNILINISRWKQTCQVSQSATFLPFFLRVSMISNTFSLHPASAASFHRACSSSTNKKLIVSYFSYYFAPNIFRVLFPEHKIFFWCFTRVVPKVMHCAQVWKNTVRYYWPAECSLDSYEENKIIFLVVSLIFCKVRVIQRWNKTFLG